MKNIAVGITGAAGFIGSHLYRAVTLTGGMTAVDIDRECFSNPARMKQKAALCDVVVHLAGLSRHSDGEYMYQVNCNLTGKLLNALHDNMTVMLGSTVHESRPLPYHASKRQSRQMIENAVSQKKGRSLTLLMSNVFGCGSRPFYNSVVSTFCHMAANNMTPEKIDNAGLQLIEVNELCREIIKIIKNPPPDANEATINHRHEIQLPEMWQKLTSWQQHQGGGLPENICNTFDLLLYSTFLSYKR